MYLPEKPPIDWSIEEPMEDSMLPVKYYLRLKHLWRQQTISECIEILLTRSDIVDMSLIRILENYGVALGNGAFVLMRIRLPALFFPFMKEDDQGPLAERERRPDSDTAGELHMHIQECFSGLSRTVFFSHGGDMYVLFCLQGETEEDPDCYTDFFETLKRLIAQVSDFSLEQGILLRFRVSNVHLTVRSITTAFQETCLLDEYAAYLPEPSVPLLLWDYRNSQENEESRSKRENALILRLSHMLKLGSAEELELALRDAGAFLVGNYPVPGIILRYRAGLFLRELGSALTSHNVVDAAFLKSCDFLRMGEQCVDRETTLETLRAFAAEAQECCRKLLVLLTTDMLLSARQYICENLKDPNLSATAVADHFAVSRTTLSARFQRFFGISMARFMQEKRVELAKHLLLEQPQLSLEDVAVESGFSAVSTMYRVFMRLEGSSPGKFRGKAKI